MRFLKTRRRECSRKEGTRLKVILHGESTSLEEKTHHYAKRGKRKTNRGGFNTLEREPLRGILEKERALLTCKGCLKASVVLSTAKRGEGSGEKKEMEEKMRRSALMEASSL